MRKPARQHVALPCLTAVRLALTLLLAAGLATGDALAGRAEPPLDTLLPADIAYAGYRLHVRKVEIADQRDGRYLLRCDIVNTGRRKVGLGPGFPTHILQTRFDASLLHGGLTPLAVPLRRAIVDSRAELAVGEWQRGREFWVTPGATGPDLAFETDDFERVAHTVKRRRPARERRPASRTTPAASAKTDGTPAAATGIGAATGTEAATNTAGATETAACVDLSLEEVRVLFVDKDRATLQIIVANSGARAISRDALPADLGLSVYLSGTPQITGSARELARVAVSERIAKQAGGGTIEPAGRVAFVQRVDVSAATRYTGVVVAQLDRAQTLTECDEGNNAAHALLFE